MPGERNRLQTRTGSLFTFKFLPCLVTRAGKRIFSLGCVFTPLRRAVAGRFSLWGEGRTGSMLGVTPLIKNMERLLMERKINTGAIDS